MALTGKNELRFGFTTRKLDSSGKLVLGISNYNNRSSPSDTFNLNRSLRDVHSPVKTVNEKEHARKIPTDLTNSINLDEEGKFVLDKESHTVRKENVLVPVFKSDPGVNTKVFPLIREKTVSIPRTKLIDDLQTVVMKSTQLYKSPEASLENGIGTCTLHTSDFIRTTYHVCDGDKDAMDVSIQSPRDFKNTKALPKTKLLKRKPLRRRWTQSPAKAPLDYYKDSCINVRGVSDLSSVCSKDGFPGSPSEAKTENVVKTIPKMTDVKKNQTLERTDPNYQIARNSLLRKSWRLAVSRASPVDVDRSEVFVSGVNIHPVLQHTPDTGRQSPQQEKIQDQYKPTELLKLSIPVFQENFNRRSPLLVWNEHQQMVAMGRPKSVNERSMTETVKRSKTLNRFELRKGPVALEVSRSHNGAISDKQQLCEPTLEGGYGILGNSSLGTNQNRKSLLQPIPDKVSQGPSFQLRTQSPVGITAESPSRALKCSPKALIEPIMRLSNTSPKMQGPSSNILDFNSNIKPDLSVHKPENGARFRVCKPMFDMEDYEDFQHKKYKKNTLKYKRCRDKAEGVHFLRVNIGEL